MRYGALVVVVLFSQAAHAEVANPDLPALLDQVARVCGERWQVRLEPNDVITITSKEQVRGEVRGLNHGPGVHDYTLAFRFKVTTTTTPASAALKRSELNERQAKAKAVEHESVMGRDVYHPKNAAEWALVVDVTRAEAAVDDIPEYVFKSLYLSEEYSMRFFVPDKSAPAASAYRRDIDAIYAKLTAVRI